MVLTGAGGKAFVSGADISKFESERSNEEAIARYNRAVERANAAIYDFPKPTIAMIRGYCIGGGVGSRAVLRPAHLLRQFAYSPFPPPSSASATAISASSGWSTWSGRPSPRRSSSLRANSMPRRRASWASSIASCRTPNSKPIVKNYADTIGDQRAADHRDR